MMLLLALVYVKHKYSGANYCFRLTFVIFNTACGAFDSFQWILLYNSEALCHTPK